MIELCSIELPCNESIKEIHDETERQIKELQEQIDCYKKLIKLEHGLDYRLDKQIPVKHEITLRDYFAGQALAGILSREGACRYDESETAKVAYVNADAMLIERERL